MKWSLALTISRPKPIPCSSPPKRSTHFILLHLIIIFSHGYKLWSCSLCYFLCPSVIVSIDHWRSRCMGCSFPPPPYITPYLDPEVLTVVVITSSIFCHSVHWKSTDISEKRVSSIFWNILVKTKTPTWNRNNTQTEKLKFTWVIIQRLGMRIQITSENSTTILEH
jgi:hypothetical protein